MGKTAESAINGIGYTSRTVRKAWKANFSRATVYRNEDSAHILVADADAGEA